MVRGIAAARWDLLAILRVARLVRRHAIDAVIVVDALRNGLLFGLLGSALSGRRVRRFCWCHAAIGFQREEFAWQLRLYRTFGLLDRTVCVSEFQRNELVARGEPPESIRVIHNGVDVARFAGAKACPLGAPEGKRLLVQVANNVFWKDPDTLLSAAAILAKRRSDFHLLLVGRGTDSPGMVRKVHGLELDGLVTLAGRREDVPSILAAADVALLITRCETFGIAALEGLAAGRCVIASDLPPLRELFEHGREGLKVPPGDADALAEALVRVLDDDALRRRLGEAGRRRARQFDQSRMAERFLGLLTERRAP